MAKPTAATGTARLKEWCRRFMLNCLLLIFMSTGATTWERLPHIMLTESVCAATFVMHNRLQRITISALMTAKLGLLT